MKDPSSSSDLATQITINTQDIQTNTQDIFTLDSQLQTLQGEILIPNSSPILVGNPSQPSAVTGAFNTSIGMTSVNSLTSGKYNTSVGKGSL
jgi:hypothetical protein